MLYNVLLVGSCITFVVTRKVRGEVSVSAKGGVSEAC